MFERFFKKPASEWKLPLGPWLLARDNPPGRIDYAIWKERWNNAQYAIAESIFSGYPCSERELAAIGLHVAGSDGYPQSSCGFAAYLYNQLKTFGDGPKMDAKGLLWRLNHALAEAEGPAEEQERNYERIGEDYTGVLEEFLAAFKAFRVWNINFDGARLLELSYKKAAAEWPEKEKWPLRLAARHLLAHHDVLLRWEIFAYDKNALGRMKWEEWPFATDFKHMLEAEL